MNAGREEEVAELYDRLRPHLPADPLERAGDYPLTLMQRVLREDVPASVQPNLTFVLARRFDERLDAEALAQAWQVLVQRHDGIRTTFPIVAGNLVQRVAPPGGHDLRFIDATHGGFEEAEASIQAEVDAGLDLEGPLFRGVLARCGSKGSGLYIVMHHLTSDGWSARIALRELHQLYDAKAAGRPDPSLRATLQCADLARWEQSWYAEELPRCRAYWTTQLSDREPPLSLRAMRPRPAGQESFASALVGRPLGVPRASFDAFSRTHDVTVPMLLLGALKALLWAEQEASSVIVGLISANRRRETISTVGLLSQHVPLRTELDPGLSFVELIRRIERSRSASRDYEHMPHELAARNLPGDPLRFRTFFNYISEATPADRWGARAEFSSGRPPRILRDLDVTVMAGDRISVSIGYNAELIEPSAAIDFSARYEATILAALDDPARPLHALVPRR